MREVNQAMKRMVNQMKQHGQQFQEMTKISSVDTIMLRNSRVLREPPRPKQYRNKRLSEASTGGLQASGERRVLIKTLSNV